MRDGYRVMDSDIHVMEPMAVWTDYLDPRFADRAPQPPPPRSVAWLTMDGRPLPAHADREERRRALERRYTSPEALEKFARRSREELEELRTGTTPGGMLRAMDVEGIDVSVVFRTVAAHVIAFDDMDPELAGGLCRAFNRWLADFCGEDPQRLHAGALVPLHDPDVAVREARFAVEQLGARTLVLPSHPVRNLPLYDRALDPLWAAAQDLDVAVSFHGIHASYTEGMLANRYHGNHVLGHAGGQPVELMLALGAIITGGVAARFPRVRFAFLEGNCSWLPWWLWALDERFEEFGDREATGQHEPPSELFRRQCYVSVEPSEALVRNVVESVGDDNLVVSTDWPHDDSAYPHAIKTFLDLPIGDESKRKILWDNCARLYGLDA